MLQEEDIVVLVKEFRLVVDSFGGRTSEEQLKLLACSNESVKLLIDPLAAEVCVPVMPVCFTACTSLLPDSKKAIPVVCYHAGFTLPFQN